MTCTRQKLVLLLAVIMMVASCLALASRAAALDPQSFAEVSDGVVQIRASDCTGGSVRLGSGFLVGMSVVMTAEHVVHGCHRLRVLAKEQKWIDVASTVSWHDGRTRLDVATLKLAAPIVNAWIFSLRPSQVPIGAYVAALGYPLGESVSMTNGRVVARIAGQHLLLRILGAQGYSGGPVVDSYGRVVGIVNAGIGDPGLLTGALTGDNIIAYDISSRWGGWRRSLCHDYPNGAIEDC